MSRRQLVGAGAVVSGLALALVVQVAAPVGVPLYDGVLVPDAYRYLQPTGDQLGDPPSAVRTVDITGGASPAFIFATTENVPQAQLVVQMDAFQLSPGASKITVSITPVAPAVQPAEGSIAGNVYRFAINDQSGTPLAIKPCTSCRTMVLRAPPDVTEGSMAVLRNGAWSVITSFHAGIASMYQADLGGAGDYAVLASAGSTPGDGGGIDLLLFGALALALFFAAVAGLFWYRRRPPPVPVARLGGRPDRVPSKRRSRKPPSGRSDQ
jgi:hypothetical protein